MRLEATDFIRQSYTCQMAKGHKKDVGLYTPPISGRPWTNVSVDFVTSLLLPSILMIQCCGQIFQDGSLFGLSEKG